MSSRYTAHYFQVLLFMSNIQEAATNAMGASNYFVLGHDFFVGVSTDGGDLPKETFLINVLY